MCLLADCLALLAVRRDTRHAYLPGPASWYLCASRLALPASLHTIANLPGSSAAAAAAVAVVAATSSRSFSAAMSGALASAAAVQFLQQSVLWMSDYLRVLLMPQG